MDRIKLIETIRKRKSFLCIGLDTDLEKLPKPLLGYNSFDAITIFNKKIIDATKDFCVSYKLNTAFYENAGVAGWEAMEETVRYIGKEHLIIADAKRGDIGNTCDQYAKAFFENLHFDAITLAPYMGSDSLLPFLKYPNKWSIVLALTSNPSANDFELLKINEEPLYQTVLKRVSKLGSVDNMMFVVGATRAELFKEIRNIIPDHFLLIPGVGTQGGTVAEVAKFALNKEIGILVNVSRDIIYASDDIDYAEAAKEKAIFYQKQMMDFI